MGIDRIDQDLCTGCGICYDDCLMDVIGFNDKTEQAYIAYPEDCAVCFQCVNACPVDAISVSSMSPRKLVLPY
jgi:NAD-dependent dihydropyrimidine dehydrogenase PreA subunit